MGNIDFAYGQHDARLNQYGGPLDSILSPRVGDETFSTAC
jgi:hypothetical protein